MESRTFMKIVEILIESFEFALKAIETLAEGVGPAHVVL